MAAAIQNVGALEQAKIMEEKNLYRYLKEYFSQVKDLKISATSYCLERDDFIFVAYAEKNWGRFVCENFSIYMNHMYDVKVSKNLSQEAKWVKSIVIVDELWFYRVKIPSKHSEDMLCAMDAPMRIDILL